jgi:hypothetical protein
MLERRSEPRFSLHQAVTVTQLGPESTLLQEKGPNAKLIDLSGKGMRILVTERFPLEAAVQVELENAMILGEVRYCVQEPNGFMIGVEIHHSLLNLAKIAGLRRAFLRERERSGESEPKC